MTAKECRSAFNGMIGRLSQLYPDPDKMPPEAASQMDRAVAMFQLQALWEIAAQIAEANADKSKIHTLQ